MSKATKQDPAQEKQPQPLPESDVPPSKKSRKQPIPELHDYFATDENERRDSERNQEKPSSPLHIDFLISRKTRHECSATAPADAVQRIACAIAAC